MRPPDHSLSLNPGVSMALQLIPQGSFRMGSRGYSQNEEPRRPNTLGDHRAVTIEEPSREAVELVEMK